MGETYYDVLGVDSAASLEEIRAAYRECVLETHPDHNDAPDATDQFRRVAEARDVLTDEDERARYDRLGHDGYVTVIELAGTDRGDTSQGGTAAGDAEPDEDATDETAEAGTTGSRDWRQATRSGTRGDDEDARSDQGPTASGSGPGEEGKHGRTRGRSNGGGERFRANGSGRPGGSGTRVGHRWRESAAGGRAPDAWFFGPGGSSVAADGSDLADNSDDATGEFRYAVHDWEGEIDLEWNGRPITHTSAVMFACLWLVYPALVAASVTTAVPLPVNAALAACTVGVVGFLLTWPRVAAAIFGSWSLLVPAGLLAFDLASPLSLVGALAVGLVWIPFGYAVGVWWTLRP